MSVIPQKTEYKNCPRERVTAFCEAIVARKIAARVSFSPTTERSHQEVYGYNANGKKATVVYDTKAQILSVTAFDDTSKALSELFRQISSAKPTQQKKKEPKKPMISDKKREEKKPEQKKAEPKKPEIKKIDPKKPEQNSAEQEMEQTSGDFSLKKYTQKRFDEAVEKIRKDKNGYKLKKESHSDKNKPTELITYIASTANQKLKLRYMPKKQVVQLQGKHGTLFAEISLILSEETDFKTALNAHIEQSKPDKKATEVERQLKKLIPSAMPYLSDSAKLNFTIAVIEILNSKAEHYDYSMLLLPAFRGLEGLIFNIQQAQGIVVKMIGQAYEKEEGNYVLKASYRRKINSVVYPEVLAALYREYFATRNHYTHSDNPAEGGTRVISSRAEATEIFNHLLKTVEYNCKKLTEISFSLTKK